MRHYYSPLNRQADDAQRQAGVSVRADVERERIPGIIDALDCLLALWVAEATLDGDAAAGAGDEEGRRGISA